jgi:hypothetical protein
VIVSTFGPEGPTKCSSLDVVRMTRNHCTMNSVRVSIYSRAPRNCIGLQLELCSSFSTVFAGRRETRVPGPRPIKPTAAPAPCRRYTHRRIFAPDSALPSR